MSTLKPIGLTRELLSPEIALQVQCTEKELSSSGEHPVSFAAFREIPWNIFGSLAACKSQTIFRTPFLDNEIVALAFRAPERVRRSPSSALRFVSASNPNLAAIPTDKWIGGNASPPRRTFNRFVSELTFKLDYFYNEGMPHSLSWLSPVLDSLKAKTKIFGQHKYLHYRSWFRKELAEYMRERVRNAESSGMSFCNVEFLRKISREHIAGTKNYIREINAVLTLEGVERLLLQSRN
jgi:asparagine synthase (glutamine-hydrolysing)